MDVHFGPSFRTVSRVFRGADEALVEFAIPSTYRRRYGSLPDSSHHARCMFSVRRGDTVDWTEHGTRCNLSSRRAARTSTSAVIRES